MNLLDWDGKDAGFAGAGFDPAWGALPKRERERLLRGVNVTARIEEGRLHLSAVCTNCHHAAVWETDPRPSPAPSLVAVFGHPDRLLYCRCPACYVGWGVGVCEPLVMAHAPPVFAGAADFGEGGWRGAGVACTRAGWLESPDGAWLWPWTRNPTLLVERHVPAARPGVVPLHVGHGWTLEADDSDPITMTADGDEPGRSQLVLRHPDPGMLGARTSVRWGAVWKAADGQTIARESPSHRFASGAVRLHSWSVNLPGSKFALVRIDGVATGGGTPAWLPAAFLGKWTLRDPGGATLPPVDEVADERGTWALWKGDVLQLLPGRLHWSCDSFDSFQPSVANHLSSSTSEACAYFLLHANGRRAVDEEMARGEVVCGAEVGNDAVTLLAVPRELVTWGRPSGSPTPEIPWRILERLGVAVHVDISGGPAQVSVMDKQVSVRRAAWANARLLAVNGGTTAVLSPGRETELVVPWGVRCEFRLEVLPLPGADPVTIDSITCPGLPTSWQFQSSKATFRIQADDGATPQSVSLTLTPDGGPPVEFPVRVVARRRAQVGWFPEHRRAAGPLIPMYAFPMGPLAGTDSWSLKDTLDEPQYAELLRAMTTTAARRHVYELSEPDLHAKIAAEKEFRPDADLPLREAYARHLAVGWARDQVEADLLVAWSHLYKGQRTLFPGVLENQEDFDVAVTAADSLYGLGIGLSYCPPGEVARHHALPSTAREEEGKDRPIGLDHFLVIPARSCLPVTVVADLRGEVGRAAVARLQKVGVLGDPLDVVRLSLADCSGGGDELAPVELRLLKLREDAIIDGDVSAVSLDVGASATKAAVLPKSRPGYNFEWPQNRVQGASVRDLSPSVMAILSVESPGEYHVPEVYLAGRYAGLLGPTYEPCLVRHVKSRVSLGSGGTAGQHLAVLPGVLEPDEQRRLVTDAVSGRPYQVDSNSVTTRVLPLRSILRVFAQQLEEAVLEGLPGVPMTVFCSRPTTLSARGVFYYHDILCRTHENVLRTLLLGGGAVTEGAAERRRQPLWHQLHRPDRVHLAEWARWAAAQPDGGLEALERVLRTRYDGFDGGKELLREWKSEYKLARLSAMGDQEAFALATGLAVCLTPPRRSGSFRSHEPERGGPGVEARRDILMLLTTPGSPLAGPEKLPVARGLANRLVKLAPVLDIAMDEATAAVAAVLGGAVSPSSGRRRDGLAEVLQQIGVIDGQGQLLRRSWISVEQGAGTSDCALVAIDERVGGGGRRSYGLSSLREAHSNYAGIFATRELYWLLLVLAKAEDWVTNFQNTNPPGLADLVHTDGVRRWIVQLGVAAVVKGPSGARAPKRSEDRYAAEMSDDTSESPDPDPTPPTADPLRLQGFDQVSGGDSPDAELVRRARLVSRFVFGDLSATLWDKEAAKLWSAALRLQAALAPASSLLKASGGDAAKPRLFDIAEELKVALCGIPGVAEPSRRSDGLDLAALFAEYRRWVAPGYWSTMRRLRSALHPRSEGVGVDLSSACVIVSGRGAHDPVFVEAVEAFARESAAAALPVLHVVEATEGALPPARPLVARYHAPSFRPVAAGLLMRASVPNETSHFPVDAALNDHLRLDLRVRVGGGEWLTLDRQLRFEPKGGGGAMVIDTPEQLLQASGDIVEVVVEVYDDVARRYVPVPVLRDSNPGTKTLDLTELSDDEGYTLADRARMAELGEPVLTLAWRVSIDPSMRLRVIIDYRLDGQNLRVTDRSGSTAETASEVVFEGLSEFTAAGGLETECLWFQVQ